MTRAKELAEAELIMQRFVGILLAVGLLITRVAAQGTAYYQAMGSELDKIIAECETRPDPPSCFHDQDTEYGKRLTFHYRNVMRWMTAHEREHYIVAERGWLQYQVNVCEYNRIMVMRNNAAQESGSDAQYWSRYYKTKCDLVQTFWREKELEQVDGN